MRSVAWATSRAWGAHTVMYAFSVALPAAISPESGATSLSRRAGGSGKSARTHRRSTVSLVTGASFFMGSSFGSDAEILGNDTGVAEAGRPELLGDLPLQHRVRAVGELAGA